MRCTENMAIDQRSILGSSASRPSRPGNKLHVCGYMRVINPTPASYMPDLARGSIDLSPQAVT